MELSVKTTVKANFGEQVIVQITPRISETVGVLAEDTAKHTRKSLQTPYPPASAPGAVPHMRTGLLQALVRHQPRNDPLWYDVVAWAAYAIHLELGTARMAARPFMRPAAKWAAQQAPKVFKRELG